MSFNTSVYPWLTAQWSTLVRALDKQRLAHAVLLTGRDGLGVDALARALVRRVLCESTPAREENCACRSCRLLEVGNHPDFSFIAPLEDGKEITVDQVRELSDYYTLKPHYGRGKIALLSPADRLNRAAANAILKILEEPPTGGLIILSARRFSAVSMTIRSRSVRISCDQVAARTAQQWLAAQASAADSALVERALAYSGGAPLAALAAIEAESVATADEVVDAAVEILEGRTHALRIAKRYAELPVDMLAAILLSFASHLVLAIHGHKGYYTAPKASGIADLHHYVDRINLRHLHEFIDLIYESKSVLAKRSGLRDIDLAESLWLGVANMVRNGEGIGT